MEPGRASRRREGLSRRAGFSPPRVDQSLSPGPFAGVAQAQRPTPDRAMPVTTLGEPACGSRRAAGAASASPDVTHTVPGREPDRVAGRAARQWAGGAARHPGRPAARPGARARHRSTDRYLWGMARRCLAGRSSACELGPVSRRGAPGRVPGDPRRGDAPGAARCATRSGALPPGCRPHLLRSLGRGRPAAIGGTPRAGRGGLPGAGAQGRPGSLRPAAQPEVPEPIGGAIPPCGPAIREHPAGAGALRSGGD